MSVPSDLQEDQNNEPEDRFRDLAEDGMILTINPGFFRDEFEERDYNQAKGVTSGIDEKRLTREEAYNAFLSAFGKPRDLIIAAQNNTELVASDNLEYLLSIIPSAIPEVSTKQLKLTKEQKAREGLSYEVRIEVSKYPLFVLKTGEAIAIIKTTTSKELWTKTPSSVSRNKTAKTLLPENRSESVKYKITILPPLDSSDNTEG